MIRQTLEGIPYRWQGKDSVQGLDCFGLANYTRKYFGLPPLPDFSHIYRQYKEHTFPPRTISNLCKAHAKPVTDRELEPFDLLILRGQTLCLGTIIPDIHQEISPSPMAVTFVESEGFSRVLPLPQLRSIRSNKVILGAYQYDFSF